MKTNRWINFSFSICPQFLFFFFWNLHPTVTLLFCFIFPIQSDVDLLYCYKTICSVLIVVFKFSVKLVTINVNLLYSIVQLFWLTLILRFNIFDFVFSFSSMSFYCIHSIRLYSDKSRNLLKFHKSKIAFHLHFLEIHASEVKQLVFHKIKKVYFKSENNKPNK